MNETIRLRVVTYNIHRGRGLDGRERGWRRCSADPTPPEGLYGNVCLSRLPMPEPARYSLTCRPFEPRCCLRADVDLGEGPPLHVLNIHLGLSYRERIRQVGLLSRALGEATLPGPQFLLGKFNEWFNGKASRLLRARFGHPNGRRYRVPTHPSPLPVFPLDRIYHGAGVEVVRMGVHRSRLARVALGSPAGLRRRDGGPPAWGRVPPRHA